jgi:DNA gyrase/topoisomerase IV subunit B
MNLTVKTRNGHRDTAVASRFSSLLTADSALFTSFSPLFPRNPFFPRLRSGHRLFQRPSSQKQFLSSITRFKGLGEISPDEFGFMIGPDMRLDPVEYEEGKGVRELLTFYMGKNTPERQDFIIENLREDVDKQVQLA